MVEGGGLLNRYMVNSRIVGSNPTPSANKSLISQKNRARFEPEVRFAAVCGPARRHSFRAGPGEAALAAFSPYPRPFSLVASFEVRFSRAIARLACVKGHELPPPQVAVPQGVKVAVTVSLGKTRIPFAAHAN